MQKLLLAFSSLLLVTTLTAQELHITQAQAPQTVPFAQPFTIKYQVSHSPSYQVTLDQDSAPEDFVIEKIQQTPLSQETVSYDLTVFPFTLGKSTFTVSFQLQQDHQAVLQQEADPLHVEVTPVKLFQDSKLREIRAPFIARNWGIWLLVLLVIILLICTLHWWKNRLQKARLLALGQLEDTRPSHVIALSKIDALLQSGLWENNQYKLFYITLVDILREYLHRRFGLDVSAETSAELLAHIKTQQNLVSFRASLRELLSASDLVKFAKAIPNEAQRNGHILILRTLVEQTTPREAPVKEELK